MNELCVKFTNGEVEIHVLDPNKKLNDQVRMIQGFLMIMDADGHHIAYNLTSVASFECKMN